eukprot:7307243-Alexandrium_andersonii.AAC.1
MSARAAGSCCAWPYLRRRRASRRRTTARRTTAFLRRAVPPAWPAQQQTGRATHAPESGAGS